MKTSVRRLSILFLGTLLLAVPSLAQSVAAPVSQSKVVKEKITSPALKANLLGDPDEQPLAVYLPPAYETSGTKRYPTVYLLHGYTAQIEAWTSSGNRGMNIQPVMDELIRSGLSKEMIVVVPSGRNAYLGSFYTNSSAGGNWENYIYQDVVRYIDGRYRTIAKPASRGIAGHSMGGYGAIMIGMKHPDVFSAIYSLSPCCLGLEGDLSGDNRAWLKAAAATNRNIFQKEPQSFEDFWVVAMVAMAAAFAPDPNHGPLFARFPYVDKRGMLVPNEPVHSEYRSRMPLYLVDQYRSNLVKLRGLSIDVGEYDEFSHIRIASAKFSDALASRGVPHSFEIYKDGDHGNKVRERFERFVVPFFSRTLESSP